MKNLKKVLIISVIFILIFSTFVFAYEFESMKTFFEESLEDYSEEQEWYDENNLPYRVKVVSDNDEGYEFEYYNCDDEYDWKKQGNKIEEELLNSFLDEEELLYNKEESNKSDEKNLFTNMTDDISSDKFNPNVFYGMKKEQCPTEETLYKMKYYKQIFNVGIGNDLNSGSPNHYDDNKTAYFYPIESKQNYVSFITLTQDGFSEYGNTIMIIDFCQFLNDGQGNWSLLENMSGNSFQNDEEKKKFEEQLDKAKSDCTMLLKLMNVGSIQCGYSINFLSPPYSLTLYKQANLENSKIFFDIKKSDYIKAQEEEQVKLKNSNFHGTYASQLNNYELQCSELFKKISNASSSAEKYANAVLLKTIANSALSFAKSIYAISQVDKKDIEYAIYSFGNYIYIAYSFGG